MLGAAAGILVADDRSRAFIGCTADNYVAVIDHKILAVTGDIATGRLPAWLFMIDNGRIYAFFKRLS